MEQAQYNQLFSFIWNIATDVLVYAFDKGEYKKIIMPMMVLRRIDVLLEPTKATLLAQKKMLDDNKIANQDPILFNTTGYPFYNTSLFTMKTLKSETDPLRLKMNFNDYLNGFSKDVQDILDKFHLRQMVDNLTEAERLGSIIEKFTDDKINLSNKPVLDDNGNVKFPALDNHTMGTMFEELLRKFNEERVDLIDAIADCNLGNICISILTDAKGAIIDGDKDNPAYVLSMSGNPILPQCLSIKSVDAELISKLQEKWHLQNIRQVADRLQKVTSVINGDHTAIRKKIEAWSAKEMNYEGMCEVLKWEFEHPTKDATAFTSDLHLINRMNEPRKACSLLLDEPTFSRDLFDKIDNKWLLASPLSKWKEILGAKTEEEASHFLYHIIGVSQRIPTDHVYFGNKSAYLDEVRDDNSKSQIDNYYCNNFDQYNKVHNYSYVPDVEFLSRYSLSEALGLILKDERVSSDIMNKSISLFYRSIKSETVRYSYSAYMLRTMPQFSATPNFSNPINEFWLWCGL